MLTPDDIARQRTLVAQEALTWSGTIYHPNAQVKGAGCDCLTLVVAAFGPVVDYGPVPHYSREWHLHKSDELYLQGTGPFKGILDYCIEVPGPEGEFDGVVGAQAPRSPLPGDIVIWKFGRCYSHGAIVVNWPTVMHAYIGRAAGTEDVARAPYLKTIGHGESDKGKRRPRRFFTLKTWAPAAAGAG